MRLALGFVQLSKIKTGNEVLIQYFKTKGPPKYFDEPLLILKIRLLYDDI